VDVITLQIDGRINRSGALELTLAAVLHM
jgi:hypothetical protein